jgi:hypothetical protein
MVEQDSNREAGIAAFEREAEVLVVHQLDLLAQLEAQLRAVHRTMRSIERLRGNQHRVGPEPSNGERIDTLRTLSGELTTIDRELNVQHQSCEDMQRSIREMQARLVAIRREVSVE